MKKFDTEDRIQYKEYNHSHKARNGFTLTELLIVVAITIILTSLGISSYTSQQRGKLLENTTREIVGYLRYAQQKSIAQEEGNQWGVYFVNPSEGKDYYALYTKLVLEGTPVFAEETEPDYKIPPILYPFYAFAVEINEEEVRFLPSGIEYENPVTGDDIGIFFEKLTGISTTSTTQFITIKSTVTNSTSTISVSGQGLISY
jgi:prepilin-type N-terminal cleavage/methylation domain-containing protein